MRRHLLRISADVHLFLNRDDPQRLFDIAREGYDCPICGLPGRLTEDQPASVLIDVDFGNLARRVARLAHAACTPSRVRLVDPPIPDEQALGWPAAVWLRPDHADPPAVLLIGPTTTRWDTTPTGEVVDLLTDALLHDGYTLLLDPLTTLPDVAGLTVVLGPGDRLTATGPDNKTVWDGSTTQPAAWLHVATSTNRVGLVVAIGLYLANPYRDHLADLFAAIRDGAVVGATARLHPRRT